MPITYLEFATAASKLETLDLEWKWIDSKNSNLPNSLGQGYLERVDIRSTRETQPLSLLYLEKEENSNAAPAPLQLISWRYHICYSYSYREPVLYFRATEQSGTPLSLQNTLKELEEEETQNHNAISLDDHPVLHTPFYMLHPCQTGEIMALLAPNSDFSSSKAQKTQKNELQSSFSSLPCRYLLAWLCVAGRPLGIAPAVSEYLAYIT